MQIINSNTDYCAVFPIGKRQRQVEKGEREEEKKLSAISRSGLRDHHPETGKVQANNKKRWKESVKQIPDSNREGSKDRIIIQVRRPHFLY